jgi:hypothetical protein
MSADSLLGRGLGCGRLTSLEQKATGPNAIVVWTRYNVKDFNGRSGLKLSLFVIAPLTCVSRGRKLWRRGTLH